MGKQVRRVDETEAAAAIAGYTIANDISMRGWQFRTKEWLQGKMWEDSTPLGPVLTTADDFDPAEAVLTTTVNGEVMQDTKTDDLIFKLPEIIAYYSQWYRFHPGDVVTTGSPAGVGIGRDPHVFMHAEDTTQSDDDTAGIFLRRNIVFERLRLLGRVFGEDRFRLVIKALEESSYD